MAIEKKLVCFKTQANFDAELAAGNIKDYSIVFIKDSQKIWTHGVYFSSLKELLEKLGKKQDILTAGDNIKIAKGQGDTLVISAEDTKYNLVLSGDSELVLMDTKGNEISRINLPQGGSIPQASTTKFGTVKINDTPGEEGIKTDSISLQTIPSGGVLSSMLLYDGNKAFWQKLDTFSIDFFTYGIRWDIRKDSPTPYRIGSGYLNKSLPIQSGMKGCIYNPKEKKLVYWLHPDNWNFRKIPKYINVTAISSTIYKVTPPTGILIGIIRITDLVKGQHVRAGKFTGIIRGFTETDIIVSWIGTSPQMGTDTINKLEVGSRLDGYDGEVFVYVPEFWIKSWNNEVVKDVRISPIEIDNTWTHQPATYVSAYRETILKTVPPNMGYLSTLSTGTSISVANTNEYCRGGDGTTDYGTNDIFKNTLGKCRTNISRADFRKAARKDGKEIMSYSQYKNILYWLWVIEYCTFNVQVDYVLPYTDIDGTVYENITIGGGYKSGGLDKGISYMRGWEGYNKEMPLVPNGYTNELGNKTGVKPLIIPAFSYISPKISEDLPAQTMYSTRWRGIEDPFGHIWQCVDGILIETKDYADDNRNKVYATDDPSKYTDEAAGISNMNLIGRTDIEDGYIREWDLGNEANILPKSVQESGTKYKCGEYNQRKTPINKLLLLGGNAQSKAGSNLSAFNSYEEVGTAKGLSYRTVIVTNDKH
nr:MAG TPA: hypothetical protein [Caudoviricetes sp.]